MNINPEKTIDLDKLNEASVKEKKELAYQAINEILSLLSVSGRVEQVYLAIDKITELTKIIYPESFCNNCTLTCCINDLLLPVSYIEWRVIKTYLDEKVSESIKDEIKSNLENISSDLFVSMEEAKNISYKYKNKKCPFLIKNKCSISPYRPVSCRTYGYFVKKSNEKVSSDKLENLFASCFLEINRWRHFLDKQEEKVVYLSNNEKCFKIIEYLNRNRDVKLLINWLQDYFK